MQHLVRESCAPGTIHGYGKVRVDAADLAAFWKYRPDAAA
jgi:hypothetical protein